jgi:hypothetical protein
MSMGKRGRKPNPNKIIKKGSRLGRPPNPNKLITPEQIEQDRIRLAKKHQTDKYKKLQLYYCFAIGREYLNSGIIPDYERIKIRGKLEILDKLKIPHVLGEEKILSPANLTDWVGNLYDHRFELQRLHIGITGKTRLACAAQRVVRLFGLDIVYLDRVTENGRLEHRYRGAKPHSDADMDILNDWLEGDRQAVVVDRADCD